MYVYVFLKLVFFMLIYTLFFFFFFHPHILTSLTLFSVFFMLVIISSYLPASITPFFSPSEGASSPWKYRRLCGIPYVVIFFVTLACLVVVGVIGGLYGFHPETPLEEEEARATESLLTGEDDEDDEAASGESSEESEYYDK